MPAGHTGRAAARPHAAVADDRAPLSHTISGFQRRVQLHRELWSQLGRIGGERTDERSASGADQRVDNATADDRSDLARAIHEAHMRLHFQREIWSEFAEIYRRRMRDDPIGSEPPFARPETRPQRGQGDEGPGDRPAGNARFEASDEGERADRTGIASVASAMPPRAGRAPVIDQDDVRASVEAEPPAQPERIGPISRNRTRLLASLLMVVGAFAAGLVAKDGLAIAAVPLRLAVQVLADPPVPAGDVPDAQSSPSRQAASVALSSRPPAAASRSGPSFLLPDSYGFYAVVDGQLTRLEPSRLRPSDTRIAIAGVITKPSPVTVPNGHIAFIAYQRDLVTSAPDRAAIRVVARVARRLTFAATGKPTIANLEDTWAIRSVSAELAVAPVPGSPEMMLIRPPDPDLSLSPGRYMLVFGAQTYDFTVDGPVGDAAQCLERTDTQNGTVYSECRQSYEPG